jgi:hypothetical protein
VLLTQLRKWFRVLELSPFSARFPALHGAFEAFRFPANGDAVVMPPEDARDRPVAQVVRYL